MDLFYRLYGTGETIIFLHGLYGSSDNWLSFIKQFENKYNIILPDLRNHGNSFHHPEHTYPAMCNDLFELVTKLKLKKIHLVGHSMGGKVAMLFALTYPDFISTLTVLDVAPKAYFITNSDSIESRTHFNLINTLLSINLSILKTREEVEFYLNTKIKSSKLVQLMMKNIKRNKDNSLTWKFNVNAISKFYYDIFEFVPIKNNTNFLYPVLFIRGEKSNYILDEDLDQLKTLFPNYLLKTIPDASHWIHADQPELVFNELIHFIRINAQSPI